MDQHSNPATRIFDLVHQALMIPQTNDASFTGVAAFAKLFRIEQRTILLLPYDIADRLIQVGSEIKMLERALANTPRMRPPVYNPSISQLTHMFSPGRLSGNWNEIRGSVDLNSLNLLESFQSSLMAFDERKIGQEELDEISGLIDDLRLASVAADLSPLLKQFLDRQIELMQRALDLYPLQGARALGEAEKVAIGDLYQSEQVLQANVAKQEVRDVSAIWKRINTACNVARAVDASIRIGHAAWELIEKHLLNAPHS